MKVKTLSLIAGAGALCLAGVASADFAGLDAELTGQYTNGGTTYDVYHVYAVFTDSNGVVGFWGGAPGLHTFSVNNIDADGNPGSGFFRADNQQSALAEPSGFAYNFDPEAADNSTFMTIGVGAGWESGDVGEVFQLTPGFSADTGQQSWGGEGGVVTNPGGPNSLADENGRVLLLQATVVAGEHAAGEILISGLNNFSAGAGAFEAIAAFSTIPAPGALALLGLAGLAGARRRRA